MATPMTSVGLFAGIGGVEEGLRRAGAAEAELLVDNWAPAQEVLRVRFPEAKLESDVAELTSLPKVDLVTAGFPCTDLSQAGRTAGITGKASGLVGHVFPLLEQADPTWLVFENVRNMLVLDGGTAMRYLVDQLESLGYRWAYRLVDSRSTGVAQRRQRVIMVASKSENPADVLLVDEVAHGCAAVEDEHVADVLEDQPLRVGLLQQGKDVSDESTCLTGDPGGPSSLRQVGAGEARRDEVDLRQGLQFCDVAFELRVGELGPQYLLRGQPVVHQELGLGGTRSP